MHWNPSLSRDFDDSIRAEISDQDLPPHFHQRLLLNQNFRSALDERLRDPAYSNTALLWIDILNQRREFSRSGWPAASALTFRIICHLLDLIPADALIGMIGGSTFMVAIAGSKRSSEFRRRTQTLVDSLRDKTGSPSDTKPEVAAGIAYFPEDSSSVEELLRFASLAAERATYIKSHAIVPFQKRLGTLVQRRHLLEIEMRKGLELRQFSIVYQPKVHLISGEVLGAEALVRWHHPHLGNIEPTEFIPIAEHSDLIDRIFDFGLQTLLADSKTWRQTGFHLPLIALNASAANVRSAGFVRRVQTNLAEAHFDPSGFELEITESLAFEDEELFRRRMRQLQAIGVRSAIDDFGTRYTGFNVLQKLPLSTIKIDRCFVQGIDRSLEMQSLCRALVAMASQLKLHTVAEGIETLGELEIMRQIGCVAGQGFLFLHPVPAADFARFLSSWPVCRDRIGFTP